ncbi:cysteine-rich venom protein 6-like isoform X2 [Ascaphus truei]|uniref:cysteine-rich venom protein 6-like isoform X2 n=1 Tax=Ascaphus truei TaxID=8439 RepID=UPI003F5A8255
MLHFSTTSLMLALGLLLPVVNMENSSPVPRCPKNMTYSKCSSSCPLTCDNYQDPPPCSRLCKLGCFCSDGLVLLKEDSYLCVEKTQCPVLQVLSYLG